MKTPVPQTLLNRARSWDSLTRWERSEVGRSLRRLGWSYGEIQGVIPVAKSTLAGWCREIRLTESQIADLKARTPSAVGVPRDTQRKRRLEVEAIRRAALSEVPTLIDDPIWVAGTVLYWGEGAKTQRMLSLDPRTLRLFMSWAAIYLEPDAQFVFSLHLHEGNHEPAAQSYWRQLLLAPDARFTKSFIKPKGTGHRKNHLPHGVCRVRMQKSANAFVRTMAWIDGLANRLASIGLSVGD